MNEGWVSPGGGYFAWCRYWQLPLATYFLKNSEGPFATWELQSGVRENGGGRGLYWKLFLHGFACRPEYVSGALTRWSSCTVFKRKQGRNYLMGWLMDTQKIRWRGNLNSMANLVMRHLLGCSCNLYTGFEDQLKTLNVLEIWNYLHN